MAIKNCLQQQAAFLKYNRFSKKCSQAMKQSLASGAGPDLCLAVTKPGMPSDTLQRLSHLSYDTL
jgi:hypothetical protein